jgi:outer membrane protein OmpA-like peptidoglycan-associated protein
LRERQAEAPEELGEEHVGALQDAQDQSGLHHAGCRSRLARRARHRLSRGAAFPGRYHQGVEARAAHTGALRIARRRGPQGGRSPLREHSARNRPTRSLTTAERDQIVSIAQKRPSIDLEVNFEYNSDAIGSKATPQVTALGQALSSADLKGITFIVAGHTDGKGGDAYNQGLSERRADAVKRFLLEKYGIEAGSLVTVGYGKSQLKNTSDPLAADNRRVQVINASDK